MPGRDSPFAWWRSVIDVEGWVVALACFVVGAFLGWIWSPLFVFGVAAAVFAVLGSRGAERIAPEDAPGPVSPVDGVVHSIAREPAPAELDLGGTPMMRVRIASSPFGSNRVYAPITAQVGHWDHDPGEQATILAMQPDMAGLEQVHASLIANGRTAIGLRVATGAFGPRLDSLVQRGDAVRAGGMIARRRLGGWADVWVPDGARLMVREGMTLVGGETVLASLVDEDAVRRNDDTVKRRESEATPQAQAPSADLDETERAAAALFARLRRDVADEDDPPR